MSDDGGEPKRFENKVRDGGFTRLDQYLDALSDQRRRYVLQYLNDKEVASVTEIAKHVAAHETDQPPSEVTEEECQPVQADLQHKHLPRLDDYGLLDYDTRTGDVRFNHPPQTFMLLFALCNLIENKRE